MDFFLQLLLSGLMLGGIYALVALGFVIIYKATGVINFAQGQLLTVGAFIIWTFLAPAGLPFWAAAIVSIVCMSLLGAIIERLTIRPMTGQPLMAVIVMTIGLGALFDAALPATFGGLERQYPRIFPTGGMQFSGLVISYEYLFSFIMSLVVFGLFVYFFQRSRLGLSMRAVADGHDTARSCGIKVGMIFSSAWMIASITAMIGGYFLGSIESVSLGLSSIGLRVFPVVIMGGLNSITGCIVAGPIVGILQMLAEGYADPITSGGAGEIIPYIIILVTLLIRPHGLFGEKHIERI